jgi:hypothetical protein
MVIAKVPMTPKGLNALLAIVSAGSAPIIVGHRLRLRKSERDDVGALGFSQAIAGKGVTRLT